MKRIKVYSSFIVFITAVVMFTSCGTTETSTDNDINQFVATKPEAINEVQNAPVNSISWDEAINHVGENQTVCGTVVGAMYADGSNGQPTFLNIGRDYPDSSRFTVVIWGKNRSNFNQSPEILYLGKKIYVSGKIDEYKGCAEMEATNPGQINY